MLERRIDNDLDEFFERERTKCRKEKKRQSKDFDSLREKSKKRERKEQLERIRLEELEEDW